MNVLNVGDTIYVNNHFVFYPFKIGRVTAKYAYTENDSLKFRRSYDERGYLHLMGKIARYSTTSYLAPTEENAKMYEDYQTECRRISLINEIKDFNYQEISIETLKKIKELLSCREK